MKRSVLHPHSRGNLRAPQLARKRRLIGEHPMYGLALQCIELGDLWAKATNARSLIAHQGVAYLIQGEDDISAIEEKMWANHSDVFALTYRRERDDAIFCPDLILTATDRTAFSRGRNTLFLAAQLEELRRGWAYQYYVFLDSDIIWKGSLARFETFLSDWGPAIGVPLFWDESLPFMHTHLFNREVGASPTTRSIYWYDQAFVAIHREAAFLLLPYDSSLDLSCHFVSQWKMGLWANLLFPGHILLFQGLEVRNIKHDKGNDTFIGVACNRVSAAVRAQVPPRLRACVLDMWNLFGFAFSELGFVVRRAQSLVAVDSNFEYPYENGLVWLHSYYPWGKALRKDVDYKSATLKSAPGCDQEPVERKYHWAKPCWGSRFRQLLGWMTCARFHKLGADLDM